MQTWKVNGSQLLFISEPSAEGGLDMLYAMPRLSPPCSHSEPLYSPRRGGRLQSGLQDANPAEQISDSVSASDNTTKSSGRKLITTKSASTLREKPTLTLETSFLTRPTASQGPPCLAYPIEETKEATRKSPRRIIFRDEVIGQTLTDIIPDDTLVDAFEQWAGTRKGLCKLRSLCQANPTFEGKFHKVVKPFIDVAHEANRYVHAIRDPPYYPMEAQASDGEGCSDGELHGRERDELIAILVDMTEILRDVVDSCGAPWLYGWGQLFSFEENKSTIQRRKLEQKTAALRQLLLAKGLRVDGIDGETFALGARGGPLSGAQKTQEETDSPLARPPRSRPSPCSRMLRYLDIGACLTACERYAPKAMLQYQKLKYRFRSVPVSAALQTTFVRIPDEWNSSWKIWNVKPRNRKNTIGEVDLDEGSRVRVQEAIETYQEFYRQLSSQTSTGAILLSHKVTTRIRRYKGRLTGKPCMRADIYVRVGTNAKTDIK